MEFVVSLLTLVMVPVALGIVAFCFVAFFKREEYYAQHATSFDHRKAVGYSLYVYFTWIMTFAAAVLPIYLVSGIVDAIRNGAYPGNIWADLLKMVACIGIACLAWMGYKLICAKTDRWAEEETQLSMCYDGLLVQSCTGRQMRFHMLLCGCGSMIKCFLKLAFCWVIAGIIILRLCGVKWSEL